MVGTSNGVPRLIPGVAVARCLVDPAVSVVAHSTRDPRSVLFYVSLVQILHARCPSHAAARSLADPCTLGVLPVYPVLVCKPLGYSSPTCVPRFCKPSFPTDGSDRTLYIIRRYFRTMLHREAKDFKSFFPSVRKEHHAEKDVFHIDSSSHQFSSESLTAYFAWLLVLQFSCEF